MSKVVSNRNNDPVIAQILADVEASHDAAALCDASGHPDAWDGKPAQARTPDEARAGWLSVMLDA